MRLKWQGTQAEQFARTRGVRLFDRVILRDAVRGGTGLGRASKAVMDAGQLIGDDIMSPRLERLRAADTLPGLTGFRGRWRRRALDGMVNDRAPSSW